MSDLVLNVPEEYRRGGKGKKEEESVASGISLIELMCRKLDGVCPASVVLSRACVP